MQQVDYSSRERIYTGHGPLQLDTGRLILSEAVKLFVASAAAWSVAVVGASMVALVWGGDPYEWRGVTILRYAAGALGAGLAALAGGVAGAAWHILVTGWYAYRRRLDDWHRAELAAYRAAGGTRVDRQLAVRALTIHEPAHALLVALSLAERLRNGQIKEPSAAALTGDVWLGRVKVGELTKAQAEEFAQALHQVGLVTGRKKGHAGKLATVDPAAVIEMVTTRAGRIRQLAAPADGDGDGHE